MSAAFPSLTVLVPAYNEAGSISDTIDSLNAQTVRPDRIIIIDDCSTDDTADVARSLGADVLRPKSNTGSKAGAQTFALGHVTTEFTMAIDADTVLAPDAVEIIMPAISDPAVAAACGLVLPRYVNTVWERGRYIEYLFAFTFYKTIQDYYEKPMISSGCFSVYRTEILKEHGGWSNRTMAEDMDLTWRFYQAGHAVRFVPKAISYPIEPHNYTFMSKQLRRWSHGFIQNVMLHWRGILDTPYLRTIVAVAFWDAVIASFVYLLVLPVLVLSVNPLFALVFLVDAPAIVIPVVYMAARRGELLKALASFPSFFVLRIVNGFFILNAAWAELVLRRPLRVYEKGH